MANTKYRNKKVIVDGITFDSKIEARYYEYLKQLKAQGIVKDFELQPKFVLLESFKKNGKTYRAITYIADFRVEYTDGHIEIIDVKGQETKDFAIKKKLFEHRYPYTLKLITFSKIDGGWITHEDLKKARKERKQQRERAKENGDNKQKRATKSVKQTKRAV